MSRFSPLVRSLATLAAIVMLPGRVAAQDPGHASAAVSIGFATSGGDTVTRGVTIGFQAQGGESLGRGVTIAFQNATAWPTASGGYGLYSLTDLGEFPGGNANSEALAINSQSAVVGSSSGTSDANYSGCGSGAATKPFIWNAAGGMQTLGPTPSFEGLRPCGGYAAGINSQGTVVGTLDYGFAGRTRPFIWSAASGMQLIDAGGPGVAQAINTAGQVVGAAGSSAFRWTATGGAQSLAIAAQGTSASAINSAGVVTGNAGIESCNTGPIKWDAANGRHYPNLDALLVTLQPYRFLCGGRAVGINDKGDAAGSFFVDYQSGSGAFVAFKWRAADDVLQRLSDLPGDGSPSGTEALGINIHDVIVGRSNGRAFVWTSAGGTKDLNALLDPSATGWSLGLATAINDSGSIVGWGTYNGAPRAFLLTPVPVATTNAGAGITIAFAEPTNTLTQLGKPRNSAFNGDPVNTASGNYIYDHTDLSVPGRGIGLEFSRFYNSLDSLPGPLGPGWTHSYNAALTISAAEQSLAIRWGDGHVDYYDKAGSNYVARYPGVYDTATATDGGTFTILQKSQARWRFSGSGRLESITDRNGNVVTLSYDGSGQLTTVQEPGGRAFTLDYDGAGRVTSVTDPLPRTVAYGYDGAGRLSTVTDVDGGVETYTYDGNGQMLTAADPRGAVYMTNTYDATKRVVTWQADAKGNQFQFAYNAASGETTITDPLGRMSVDAHDVLGRLIRQTDRLGKSVSYTYDALSNRASVTNQNGATTTYSYDSAGNQVGKIDALGHASAVTHDAINAPLTRTDEAGGVTSFTYDSRGNLLTTTDPLGHVTRMTYDAYGQALTLTDAMGGVVTNAYDGSGNLVSTSDPAGALTTFTYDAIGRKRTSTDARAQTTAVTYNGAGSVLTTTDALAGVIAHLYDANGNRTRTTDVRGGVTTFAYDANNLLTTATDSMGGITRHTYDALNRRVTTTNALNQVTTFGYDGEGRITQTTDPTGAHTRMAYDGVGNKTAVTDANGHITSFVYDGLNRSVATIDPLGHVTTQAYDMVGHVTKSTDAAGRTTTFTYDAAGRLTQVTDPAGGTARYTYDAVGNRLTMVDPNNRTTTLTYDAANRLLTSVDPLGRTTANTYDAVGNRASVTDANGAVLSYTYDALNRLTRIQPPSGMATTFAYDGAGNRIGMVDPAGTTAYTYDLMNRLMQYSDIHAQSIGYEYDAVGNRTALIYPDGKRVAYVFNGAQRMTRVTDWSGRITQYSYDPAGQMTGAIHANGTTVSAAYDMAGRLTSLANRKADTTVLASYAYTLDAAGNRASVVQQEPLQASPTAASLAYAYNAANQIQAAGAVTFTGDSNGNVTSSASPVGTTTYSWNVYDRLTQASDGAVASQYVYNGAGTRVARTVSGVTTRFVVDPQPLLSQVLVETDDTGAVTARYIYGLGLVSRVDTAGATLTYHFDPRGSTVAMTDSTQAVVNRYAYDEFGAVRLKQEAVAQPFAYVGQLGVTHEPNGLLFMRARYMTPGDGRFLSRDPAPIMKSLQDLNAYSYVNNRPVLLADPSGLSPHRSERASLTEPILSGARTGREWLALLTVLKRSGAWATKVLGLAEKVHSEDYGSSALSTAADIVNTYSETKDLIARGELRPEVEKERNIVVDLFNFGMDFNPVTKFADGLTGGLVSKKTKKSFDQILDPIGSYCVRIGLSPTSSDCRSYR